MAVALTLHNVSKTNEDPVNKRQHVLAQIWKEKF